jgi:MerR family copper efflux transcriptional regulator
MLEVKGQDDLFSIGEVAEHFGVAVSALRYYDERGILAPAERRGAVRTYGTAELERLALIQMLRCAQLSLQEIADVLAGPDDGRRWHDVLRQRIDAITEQQRRAEHAKVLLELLVECPRENPVADCPVLADRLRRGIRGERFQS